MRDELEQALYSKYPKILFRSEDETTVSTPFWGFECGDGWFNLIDELCQELQKTCDEEGYQVKAVQIKEKFGELRFYIEAGSDKVYDLIDKATLKSRQTCEKCGNPGRVRGRGWMYCACVEHSQAEDIKDDERGPG